MHRTQVSLDEPLYEELRRQAFERRVSMALLVREALAEYLGLAPEAADGSPAATDAAAPTQEPEGGRRVDGGYDARRE